MLNRSAGKNETSQVKTSSKIKPKGDFFLYAGKKCVIVDVIDEHYVLIDGQTRRRKCNIKHLEPLTQLVKLNKNAPAPEVVRILKQLDILIEEKKPEAKKIVMQRPKRTRRKKEKPVKQAKGKIQAKETKKRKDEKKKSVESMEQNEKDSVKEQKNAP